MTEFKDITKTVKKALANTYGFDHVSVKRGRGTAYGWVECQVNLDLPSDCRCCWVCQEAKWNKVPYLFMYREELQDIGDNDGNLYGINHEYLCPSCKTLLEKTSKRATEIVHNCGVKYGTYYADDGYNSEHSEVLIQVEIGNFERVNL
jgi:hypothetical protein